MIIYDILQYLLVTIIGMLIGHHLILALFAFISRHDRTIKQSAFNNSFLIIIHVNGHEDGISKTLYSLYGLIYPSNLYEIIVIADNYTQSVADIARKFGAAIYEGNPQCQKWNPDEINKKLEEIGLNDIQYDAVVVIKPGGLISGNFLEVMNFYLENGNDVLQSSNIQIENTKNWITNITHAVELLYNHINMLGRKKLGLAVRLTGNGMCFKTQVLKRNAFELLETANKDGFAISLISKGIHINYVPEVIVWSQSNNTELEIYGEENRQWLKQFQIKISHFKSLLGHFYKIKKKPLQEFDALISLITPSFLVLLSITIAMTLLNGLLWILAIIPSLLFWLWLSLFGLTITYLMIGIFTDRDIFFVFNTSLKSWNKKV